METIAGSGETAHDPVTSEVVNQSSRKHYRKHFMLLKTELSVDARGSLPDLMEHLAAAMGRRKIDSGIVR